MRSSICRRLDAPHSSLASHSLRLGPTRGLLARAATSAGRLAMNWKQKWVPVAVVAATLAIPATSRAADSPAQREQGGVARLSAANALSARHGRYMQARAIALEGDGSVRGRAAAWVAASQTYVDGWTQVLALTDLRESITYASFEAELTQRLNAQTVALVNLTDEGARIDRLSTSALTLMATPETIPAFAESASYKPMLDALVAREGELRMMLSDVGQLASAKATRIGEIDSTSRRAVLGRLKAALLASGRYPLDQTLAQVGALLTAEKAVDPVLARLEKAFTKMNEYNANLAIFHGEAAFPESKKDCADARQTLSAIEGPTKFVADAKLRAEQLCTGIESLHTSLTGDASITKAELVAEYLRTEKTRLPSVCKRDVASPPCEKLALLAALTGADLAKMDDARLRFVELGWSEAMDRALQK